MTDLPNVLSNRERLKAASVGYPYSLILRFGSPQIKHEPLLFVYRAKYKLSVLGQRFATLDRVASALQEREGMRVEAGLVGEDGLLLLTFEHGVRLSIYPSVPVDVLDLPFAEQPDTLARTVWELEFSKQRSLFALERERQRG